MKVLALEAYMGGSHQAFLEEWAARSRHRWTILSLPANKWKWRMRHGAITFAEQTSRRIADVEHWDVVFCSDMLNLAEFAGLVDRAVADIPRVAYFHENQLTYPVRFESERDYQYVMTNFTTALAAHRVWFNSAFHRDEFLSALEGFFRRMPDHQPLNAIEAIRQKSSVHPPGIDSFEQREPGPSGPLHILWVARWEHDKNPEDFFAAMKILKERRVDFRLSVIGEQFREMPEVFARAKDFFATHIDRWGYQAGVEEYRKALQAADVVVSTANHEFFGISIVEAIAAGAYPVLPNRLAYPEIISDIESANEGEFFYDGTVDGLADKLIELCRRQRLWGADDKRGIRAMHKYGWLNRTEALDDAIEEARR